MPSSLPLHQMQKVLDGFNTTTNVNSNYVVSFENNNVKKFNEGEIRIMKAKVINNKFSTIPTSANLSTTKNARFTEAVDTTAVVDKIESAEDFEFTGNQDFTTGNNAIAFDKDYKDAKKERNYFEDEEEMVQTD